MSVWFNENFGWQCEWVYFIWKVICYKRQKTICYLNTSILTSLWTRRWEWNRKGKSVNKEGMCDTSHLFIKFHYVIFCKYRFIRLFQIFRIIYTYMYTYYISYMPRSWSITLKVTNNKLKLVFMNVKHLVKYDGGCTSICIVIKKCPKVMNIMYQDDLLVPNERHSCHYSKWACTLP